MPRRFLEGVVPSALLDAYDFWGSHSASGVRNDKGVVTGPTDMLIGYQKRPPSRSDENTRQGTLLVVRFGGEDTVVERWSLKRASAKLKSLPVSETKPAEHAESEGENAEGEDEEDDDTDTDDDDDDDSDDHYADEADDDGDDGGDDEEKDQEDGEKEEEAQINVEVGTDEHTIDNTKPASLLLNTLTARPDTGLYRVLAIMTQLEDLSHILAWSEAAAGGVPHHNAQVSSVELPRLRLTFTVRALPVASYDTESERDLFALYCDNYEGLRVSDCRDPTVLELLKVGINFVTLSVMFRSA